MRIANPLPSTLAQESRKAARIFKSFVNPTGGLDGLIPSSVLRSAHGFAIFTVVKAGFLMSVRAGTGLVIARLPSGEWSAPSAIGTGGMGFGSQAGAELTEFILVLNSKSALRQFMSAGSLTIGGNMSVALGPLGRNAEGAGSLNTKGKLAAMYSYSKTKGAFVGISIEGSAIVERQDCNAKAYGPNVTATMLLSGLVEPPPFASVLVDALSARAGSFTEYVNSTREPGYDFGLDAPMQDERDPFGNEAAANLGSLSSPASPDTYRFGAGNPSASLESPKRPAAKRPFNVGSWRKNSSTKNSPQTTPDLRHSPFVAPWVQTADAHSQEDQEDQRHTDGLGSQHTTSSAARAAELRRSIAGQTTMTPRKLVFDELFPTKKTDDDRLSLSSIGSEDHGRLGALDHWPHDDQSNGVPGARESREATKAGSQRWNVKKSEPLSTGMVDDLMSFDQLGPPSPTDDFRRSSTELKRQDWTSAGSPDQMHNDTHFGESPRSRSQTASSQASNGCSWAARLRAEDFLIGTGMPSVVRTQTELAGFLGKAVGMYDFEGSEAGDLSFRKGDVINVVEKIDDQWWRGSIGLRRGIFPVNRVQTEMK